MAYTITLYHINMYCIILYYVIRCSMTSYHIIVQFAIVMLCHVIHRYYIISCYIALSYYAAGGRLCSLQGLAGQLRPHRPPALRAFLEAPVPDRSFDKQKYCTCIEYIF